MKNNTTPKAVICNETNEFFFSQALAAKKFNISPITVANICNGKTKKPHEGHTFRYATEEEIASVKKEIVVQEKSVVKGKGKRGGGNTEPVFNFSTGDFYTSAVDAAEHLDATHGHVSFVCRNKGRTVKGNKLCYVKNINEHLDEIAESIHKANMYDDMMTKEAKKKELINHLAYLEATKETIVADIENLNKALEDVEKDIEEAKLEVIKFAFS